MHTYAHTYTDVCAVIMVDADLAASQCIHVFGLPRLSDTWAICICSMCLRMYTSRAVRMHMPLKCHDGLH